MERLGVRSCLWLLALVLLLGSLGQAEAVTIPAAASVAPPPAGAGTGLNGFFFNASADNNAQADAVIAGSMPTATFMATLVDYPNGFAMDTVNDATALSTFLGADAASLSGAGATTLEDSVFHFTGFIKITSDLDTVPGPGLPTIDVTFALGSDDGSRLRIGGVTVLDHGGIHGFQFVSNLANFEAAGLYPLELIYYENFGLTGVDMRSSIGQPPGTFMTVPTAVLFPTAPTQPQPIPEPGTLALLGTGLLGLFGYLWRRR